ncbi:MAG: CDP-alcohol phosphatidyltransferase family protein [Spirochaetes bacterium]|nr:CDP-alcohol phosphatidyltransferase family protein [Spirochaetota bacterium]
MKIEEYRKLCQKNENENYFFDKYVFRKISIYFTIFFIFTGFSANTVTFLSLLCSIGASWFALFNTDIALSLVVILIFLYYILDHVDGELARYLINKGKMKPSLVGAYFDQLVHKYSANLILFSFGYAVFTKYEYTWALFTGFICCIGLSGFPNLLNYKVILQKIITDPDIMQKAEYKELLDRCDQKGNSIKIIQKGLGLKKYKKIAGEILVFPGGVLLCAIAALLDLVFIDIEYMGFGFNFRLLLIVGLTPVYLLKVVLDWKKWMIQLKNAS